MSEPEFPSQPAGDPALPPAPESPGEGGPWATQPPVPNPWAIPTAPADASFGASADAWAPASPTGPTEPGGGRRPWVFVAALALALIAGAGTFLFLRSEPTPTGPAESLRLAFDRGDRTTYDIRMSMDGSVDLGPMGEQPLTVDVTESVGWKVIEVDDDGVATVKVSVDGATGSANGVPLPPDAARQEMTFRVTPDGQIVDGNGLAFGAAGSSGFGGFPGMDQVTPILPPHEVAPGDEWDKRFEQSFPFGEGKIVYTAHSTFERYEQVDGVRAAVITTRYTVPLDFSIDLGDLAKSMGETGASFPGIGDKQLTMTYGGSGDFTQTSWLDVAGKQVLKSSSNGDFDMTITVPGLEAQLGTDGLHMKATFALEMTRR
jgi:hypothetical protein